MEEIWKDIPGYEGLYQCSNFGNIKSILKGGIVLKQSKNRYGYPTLGLYKNGNRVNKHVHQLVAITFLGHVPNGLKSVVDHMDGDRANNYYKNLRIITNRENTSASIKKKNNEFSSRFVGVCYANKCKKWQAQIRIKNKQIFLGYFDSEIKASDAYQKKLLSIK